ncbi:MAG: AAA family ATPase [Alphaproteobacteria bacterium]|nr:AAA family ATPase [Alphaproteobacteria bacterium]
MQALTRIAAKNFLSLRDVTVPLGPLNVLVGPNGAGKTNLLRVINFLGELARLDLGPAVAAFGGFERLFFRGVSDRRAISLTIEGRFTENSDLSVPDRYEVSFGDGQRSDVLTQYETFSFTKAREANQRIDVKAGMVWLDGRKLDMSKNSSGLATLRKLGKPMVPEQVNDLAVLLETFRIFEVDVAKARMPSAVAVSGTLAADAGNLASFLAYLKQSHEPIFDQIVDDMRYILPGFVGLHLTPIGGAAAGMVVELEERGLGGRTPLAAASFGTIRALALLAMLHDPDPPRLTCVEEVDHGLHPYALDRLVERLREASQRTQMLVATHSPALVNRLRSDELIVCERDPATGASIIPAIDAATVRAMAAESDLLLGELWFSGCLGGVPS